MSEGHSSISICAKCLWSVWVCSNYVQYVPSIALVETVQLSEQLLFVLNVDIHKTTSLVHRPLHAQVSRSQYKLMQITTDNASPLHLVSVAITDILWYMTSDVVTIVKPTCTQDKLNIQVNTSFHVLTQSSVHKGRGCNVMVCVHCSASQTQSNHITAHLCLLLHPSSCL